MSYERKYRKGENVKNEVEFQPKETVAEVSQYPSVDVPERNIRKEAPDRFGVKVAVS